MVRRESTPQNGQIFLFNFWRTIYNSVLVEGGELCGYCASIVRLLSVNSACIVRE